MTEEKKKEEAKKQEVVTVYSELSSIFDAATESIREQELIYQHISNSMAAMDTSMYSGILASLDCLHSSLTSIGQISTSWRENAAILSVIDSSASPFSALEFAGSQMKQMHENIEAMGKLIEMPDAKMPEIIIPIIKEVDSQKDAIIRSLVSQIEYLESELNKEKTEKKDLLALLEDKRKELKKQYVS